MTPIRPVAPTSTDARLDDVIEQIEGALPHIHKLCKVNKKQKRKPATGKLSREAKSRFQELCEDPIVSSCGTEIISRKPTEPTEPTEPRGLSERESA